MNRFLRWTFTNGALLALVVAGLVYEIGFFEVVLEAYVAFMLFVSLMFYCVIQIAPAVAEFNNKTSELREFGNTVATKKLLSKQFLVVDALFDAVVTVCLFALNAPVIATMYALHTLFLQLTMANVRKWSSIAVM